MDYRLRLFTRLEPARREHFFCGSARGLGQAAALVGVLLFSSAAAAQATGAASSGTSNAGAVPIAVQTVSPLPPGMTAVRVGDSQGRRYQLQLQVRGADGQPALVTQLPLAGPSAETVYINGFLYVASGDAPITVVDVREPANLHPVASVTPGGAVVSLWGGTGTLLVRRADGLTLLFDVSDPEHPRYQSVVSAPPSPAPAPEAGVSLEELLPPPKPAYSRIVVSLRPFLFFTNGQPRPTSGGSLIDFSYQRTKIGGLWWGVELAPFSISSYYDGEPSFNSRMWFGYSWQSFAMAAAFGSGYNSDATFFQLGPVFRFGRIDRVHSTLRFLFSVFLPTVYPSSSEFTLEGPINRRLGLRYNFTQDSALNGFHTALGLQVFLGGDRRLRTTVLTPGLGFMYMRTGSSSFGTGTTYVHHPGVIFSLSIEPRW